MAELAVGLLHPGEMGAALGAALRSRGVPVLWASEGRSVASRKRAEDAGLEDVGSVAELMCRSEVLFSVCPPHAALDVAETVAGYDGLYVDANAVSPKTARAIAETVGDRCVDASIIGPPPRGDSGTRLYLAGREVNLAAGLFAGTLVDTRILAAEIGAASAVKMAYAAWTKGTAALLLGIRAIARAEDVEPALLEEWRLSLPDLEEQSNRAARTAAAKGWRWVGEMEEIAATFAAAGLPDGFHLAAAEVFRTSSPDQERVWPLGEAS